MQDSGDPSAPSRPRLAVVLGRWQPWLAVAAFCLVTGIIALRTVQRLEVPGRPELPNYGMQDFRDMIYYPVRTLLEGDNPYSPSAVRRHYAARSIFPLYTPIHLAVHLPYGLLSQRHAELVHFVLTTALIVIIALVCLRLCGLPSTITNVFGFAAFLAASRPGYQNLYYGEVGTSLALATYGALRFGRTRPWVAGACLAFACLKPTFGIPLAIVLLASGALSAVILGGMLAFLTSLVTGAFVLRAAGGFAPLLDAIKESIVSWAQQPEASGATGISSVDTVALIDRLWDLPAALEVLLSVAILTLGALAVARAARTRGQTPLLAESVASLTILTFTHHQFYDVLLLSLPITALASGRLPLTEALRWGLMALLTMAAFNHFSSYEILDGFGIVGPTRLAIISATGIGITLTMLVLSIVALTNAPAPPTPRPN